jgi:hypothetical protein
VTGNERRLSIDDVVDTVVGGETGFLQEMSVAHWLLWNEIAYRVIEGDDRSICAASSVK